MVFLFFSSAEGWCGLPSPVIRSIPIGPDSGPEVMAPLTSIVGYLERSDDYFDLKRLHAAIQGMLKQLHILFWYMEMSIGESRVI